MSEKYLLGAAEKGPISGGMVVAPQQLAVEVGAQVLQNGGNAIDAAVTTAFAQGVVDRTNCGLAGFGVMHVYVAATGEQKIIDFHGKAGSKVTPGMWEDIISQENPSGYGYTLKGNANERGYTAITTPGTVAGLYEGLTRYGSIRWEDAIQPAIELASEGFAVTQATAKAWTSSPESSPWTKVRDVSETGGAIIVNKAMAKTLKELAEGGPDVFYRGAIAQKIAADMKKNGGFITLRDLNDYKVTVYEPLCSTYRDYTVASNHSPGGGITVIESLNILEGYDLAAMEHNSPLYISSVSMAMKAAFADRVNFVGDPAFVEVPTEKLISKEAASQWREKIERREEIIIPRWQPKEPANTTHVSTIDSAGNAVALTHSLGSASGVVTPGLGFIYNNCMNCFNPVPGEVNSILPGKSRVTGMAPTIVQKDGLPIFITGAPGGTRIITGVLQSILNVIDHKMSAVEAVSAARFDCQGPTIEAQARIPSSVCESVRLMGHDIRLLQTIKPPTRSVWIAKSRPDSADLAIRLERLEELFFLGFLKRSFSSYGGIGLVHAIKIDRDAQIIEGGADPAGGGMAIWVSE